MAAALLAAPAAPLPGEAIVPGIGYAAWGHGGQFVLVVPRQDLVLVQTAFPDTDLPDSDLPDFLELVRPLLTQE